MKSRYLLNIIIRVLLLCLNCFVLIWLLHYTERPATILFVFFLLVMQTVGLVFYHTRVMRDLENFLVFLEENDTTLTYSKKRIERSFQSLVLQLDKINKKLQAARIERERHYYYLQTLVKQIDTGIISYDQNGDVGICNPAAKVLLGLRHIKNISELSARFPELSEEKLSVKKIYSSAVKIEVNGIEKMLAVKVGVLKFDDQWIRLLSLHNIKSEMEAGELDAWRKLIRIQRHEIINSLTPITTLTTAIKRRFITGTVRRNTSELTDDHIIDALRSVEVIEERSKGLIAFMERFKGITELPGIKSAPVNLRALFNSVNTLFQKDLQENNITLLQQISPEKLTLQGDERLLEQVVINLVKNSIEAIDHDHGRIQLTAFQNASDYIIQVVDNGIGIDRSELESIFVPSYTTKENGSGIGLSISRQIIQLHRGTIDVRSVSGVETTFEITLPG